MRIGITGASGFVGRSLTAEAVRQGHQVVAYSRNSIRPIPGAKEVRDFSNPAEADLTGLDVLVHLAGEPVLGLWTEAKKRKIRESRIEGTRGLVRAIEHLPAKKRPKTLIAASATGFYGDGGNAPLDEDNDPGFGFLARVVRDWEAASQEAEGVGVRVVLGRIGVILGQSGGAAPLLRRVFGLCLGGRLGSGKQWMPWVHIADVARMFLHCATKKEIFGPVNFVSPNPVTNREFTRSISEVLKRPAILPAPAFMLRLAPGGMEEMFLFSQRVEPAILSLSRFEWRFPHCEAALADALVLPEAEPRVHSTAAGELKGTVVDLEQSKSAP